MTRARSLLFALLPLFAACQVFTEQPATPSIPSQRLQGELSSKDGQLLFRPCQEQRRFAVINEGGDFYREAAELLANGPGTLFADLQGHLGASQAKGIDGQLEVQRFFRIQHEGYGCEDPNFRNLTLRAVGHEPEWSLSVGRGGLVLDRPGQEPLALPYLEEHLPEGRFNLSSEANNQRLELWVAPQRCVDSMSGAVHHLAAELRLNGEVMRGCAHYGGARQD